MRTGTTRRGRRARVSWALAAAVAAVPLSGQVRAGSGVWTSDASATWEDMTRWSGGTAANVADGAGFTADFASGVDIGGNRTVTLGASHTIGNLLADDTSHTFTFAATGGSTLTFATNTTNDADGISNLSSGDRHTVTFNSTLQLIAASTVPIRKDGIGLVVLANTTNNLTGAITLNAGTLQANTNFGSIGPAQVAPNITIAADGVLRTDFDFADADWQPRVTTASAGSLALRSAAGLSVDVTNHQALHLGAAAGQTVTLNAVTLAAADPAYNFGGGGGTLVVPAGLPDGAGPRGLVVRSPASSQNGSNGHQTVVRLTGTNTFTGNTTVGQHSALLYAGPASMGGSTAARFVTVDNSGVVGAGTSHTFANLQTELLDRIVTTSAGTFAITQNESQNLDFSAFGSGGNLRFGAVGTAAYAGNLTVANGATLRLGGSGTLTLSQPLPTNITGIEVAVEVAGGAAQSTTVRFTGNNAGLTVPINVGVTGANSATGASSTLLIGAQSEIGSGAITLTESAARVRLLDGAVIANTVTLGSAGGASKTFGTSGAAGGVVLNGALNSNETTNREAEIDVSTGMTLTINGQLGGTGDLEKAGSGLLILTNPANAIAERFDVSSGDVRFTYNVPSSFANTAASAGIFLRGGNVELVDGINIAEGITMEDAGGSKAIRLQDNVAFTGSVNNVTLNDTTASSYEHDFDANDGVLSVLGSIGGTSTSGIDILGSAARQGTVRFDTATTTAFTKRVRLEGGFLRITAEEDLGSAPAAFSADHLFLSGGHLDTYATFAIDDANRGIGIDASSAIRVAEGTTLTVQVPLAGASNTVAYVKRGGGTLVLNRAAAATADLSLNHGTVRLDFAAAGAPASQILVNAAGTALILAGGTLEAVGTATGTNAQAVAETVVDPGFNVVSAQAGTGGTMAVTLGTLTRNQGSVLNVVTNAGGTVATPTGTAGELLTNSTGQAYATVGGGDWAAKDAATPALIVAGSTIPNFYTPSTSTTLAGNADVAADTTLGAASTPASIRFNEAAARTITATGQMLTTGGILVTANVGANAVSINGGTLRATNTATTDLPIIQNNTAGDLTIGAVIANNTGAKALTKAGPGRLVLTAANTYTGQTWLMDGTLSVAANANLGDPATGARVTIDGGTLEATATFALDNLGANPRPISLGDRGGTFRVTAASTLTVTGVIDREGSDTAVNGLTKSGPGTLLLRAANIYSGPTTVADGVLQVGDGTSATAITGNNSTRNVLSVLAAGALTGTGTIAGAGAATPHSIAGTLGPGATAAAAGDGEATLAFNGELTQTGTSTTVLSIVAPTGNAGGADALGLPSSNPGLVTGTVPAGAHDHLEVSHRLLLSAGDIVVDAATLGAYASPAPGDVFNLIDAGSIVLGGFNPGPRFQDGTEIGQDLDLPPLTGGLTWDTGLFASHGAIVVVPEPGSAAAALAGLAGLLAGRRRRPAAVHT